MSISIELCGRLGNCLFELAALRVWALRTGFEPSYPEWEYAHYFKGNFTNTNKFEYDYIYQEPYFHYKELPSVNNCLAKGYFQSEKYFVDYESEIREMFEIREELIPEHIRSLAKIPNTVSIHVRRGDYITTYPDHFHVQTMDYYTKAMSLFSGANFIICSDDLPWCKANFIGPQFTFSEGNVIEDLWLMSHASRGNIGANSSLSFWGQYLNSNKNKKVVMPKKWFNFKLAFHNTKDLYMKEWIVI